MTASGNALRAEYAGAPGSTQPEADLVLIAQRAVWEVKERTEALERSSHKLGELLAAMAHADSGDAELLVPAESLVSHHELLAWQCSKDLVVFLADDWRSILLSPGANPAPFSAALVRGARVRVVIARSESAHDVEQAVQVMDQRVEWRSVDRLPVSMMVADHRSALMSAGTGQGATLLQVESAAVALRELFDVTWQHAATVDVPGGPARLDAKETLVQHTRLAALLAAGATDESIARAMGISVRKLVRLVSAMRADLHADTRFQMGVRAAREGLV